MSVEHGQADCITVQEQLLLDDDLLRTITAIEQNGKQFLYVRMRKVYGHQLA